MNLERMKFITPMIISVVFFLRKGIQYAIIGSYVPLLMIATTCILILLAWLKGYRLFIVMIKVWAAFITLWSLVRILFSVVHNTVKPFNEFHLTHQFGFWGFLLSISMLIVGCLIIKYVRSVIPDQENKGSD